MNKNLKMPYCLFLPPNLHNPHGLGLKDFNHTVVFVQSNFFLSKDKATQLRDVSHFPLSRMSQGSLLPQILSLPIPQPEHCRGLKAGTFPVTY